MNDDLSRITDIANLQDVPVDDVLANPRTYGLTDGAVTRYNNAVKTRDGLVYAEANARDAADNTPDALLLRYRPEAFGGDGAAAIAMGNPDEAPNTAVVVKGLGTGVAQGTMTNPDAKNLYIEANRADPDHPTSVVLWVGYDAPDAVADPGLYEPNMARTGGQALAGDVNGFAVTHEGAPGHMTVVGHSYGSTTVADAAARYGMHADDVVLIGSPGTDFAHSAADFNLRPGGHVYVGAASQDAVTGFGHNTVQTPIGGIGLGDDPAMDGHGYTRFKAEPIDRSLNPFYAHSHYFDPGSESLYSMADVATGHGDQLERHGMTAPHRQHAAMPPILDRESGRRGTTGHYHGTPW